MNLRKGFAILEVMLALAIGAILSVILIESIASMGRSFKKISAVSSLERRFTLIQQQFDRDFSGVIAPSITLEEEQLRVTEDDGSGPDDKEKKEIEDKATPKAKTDSKKEKPKKKRIPYAFFSKNSEGGNCTQLTCITTNPVAVYGEAMPRLARVVYSLDPDPEHEGLFLLSRQQSDILDFKNFSSNTSKPIRKYTISDGIQSLKIDYLAPKPPEKINDQAMTREEAEENRKKRKEQAKKKPKRELIPLSEWKYFETDEEEEKSKRPPIPVFIHVTLTLIDEQKRPSAFELWYAPLYDGGNPYVIEDLFTLSGVSEQYYDKFTVRKSRQTQIAHLGARK